MVVIPMINAGLVITARKSTSTSSVVTTEEVCTLLTFAEEAYWVRTVRGSKN